MVPTLLIPTVLVHAGRFTLRKDAMTQEKVDPGTDTALPPKKLRPIQALVLGLVGMGYGDLLATLGAYLMIFTPNAPLLTLAIVFLVILAVAQVVAFFAKRYVGRGGLLTYAFNAGGTVPGVLTGATLLIGNVLLVAVVVANCAIYAISVFVHFDVPAASPIMQTAVLAGIGIVSTLICLRGLRSAADAGGILGLICLPFVAWVLIQGGLTMGVDWGLIFNFDLTAFDPSIFVVGLVIAGSSYFGFEQVTTLAADTESPKRSIPLILFGCVAVGAPVMLLSLVFGARTGILHVDAIEAGESPLAILANAAGLHWLAVPLDVMVLASSLALLIAVQTYGSQLISTMGEIGLLPRRLSHRSSRRNVPVAAIVTTGVIAIVAPMLVALISGGSPVDTAIYLNQPIGYLWAIAYIVIGVLALWVIARTSGRHWLTASCALVVVIGFVVILAFSMKDGFSTMFAAEAWIAVISVALLFAMFWILHVIRSKTGHIDMTRMDEVE